MEEAGAAIPKLVCSLVDDGQLGRQMLDGIISALAAARVSPVVRRSFAAQSFEAALSSEAVASYRRIVDDEGSEDAWEVHDQLW